MNYITALLMIGTFLMLSACGDDSSAENSNEPINEEYIQNKNRLQKKYQDSKEPRLIEDDIQAVSGDNNFNDPYSDPGSDPYNHPYSNPYSDPNN